eukprot:1061784-Rhodomonas_salina.1
MTHTPCSAGVVSGSSCGHHGSSVTARSSALAQVFAGAYNSFALAGGSHGSPTTIYVRFWPCRGRFGVLRDMACWASGIIRLSVAMSDWWIRLVRAAARFVNLPSWVATADPLALVAAVPADQCPSCKRTAVERVPGITSYEEEQRGHAAFSRYAPQCSLGGKWADDIFRKDGWALNRFDG